MLGRSPGNKITGHNVHGTSISGQELYGQRGGILALWPETPQTSQTYSPPKFLSDSWRALFACVTFSHGVTHLIRSRGVHGQRFLGWTEDWTNESKICLARNGKSKRCLPTKTIETSKSIGTTPKIIVQTCSNIEQVWQETFDLAFSTISILKLRTWRGASVTTFCPIEYYYYVWVGIPVSHLTIS